VLIESAELFRLRSP